MADKELGRKREITKTLDYLCQQIGHLDVTSSVPEEIGKREVLIDRSVDVRTACMLYITAHIRYNATLLGIVGKPCPTSTVIDAWLNISGRISRTLLQGNENLDEAKSKLKSSVESYNQGESMTTYPTFEAPSHRQKRISSATRRSLRRCTNKKRATARRKTR